MKVISKFLNRLHLDPKHSLLTGRNVHLLREYFAALDAREQEALDDVEFLMFMRTATDLSDRQIYKVFDMFDVDASGSLEFDEFYLLCCMLIAIKDKEEMKFLFRHSRTCFELLDEDRSETVDVSEFITFGFLFNFTASSVRQIFKDFDVSGDKELDYDEFRMFTFACIEKQNEIDARKQDKLRRREDRRTQKRIKSEIKVMNNAAAGSIAAGPSTDSATAATEPTEVDNDSDSEQSKCVIT